MKHVGAGAGPGLETRVWWCSRGVVRIQNAARGRGSPRPGGGAAQDGRPPAERIGLLRPPAKVARGACVRSPASLAV